MLRFGSYFCFSLILVLLSPWVYAGGTGHSHGNSLAADNLINKELKEADSDFNLDLTIDEPSYYPPHTGGYWSKTHLNWDVLAVHATLLPNGKILSWDATPDDFDGLPHSNSIYTTRVTLWSPPTVFNSVGSHERTDNDTDTDLFCAGSGHLWDGRVVFSGGDTGIGDRGENGPSENSSIYDYVLNKWERLGNMYAARWYSSIAILSSGKLLTLGGTYNPDPYAEILHLNKIWEGLNITAPYNQTTGDYQWVQTADVNGDDDVVYVFGPHQDIFTVDTKNGGSSEKWINKRDEEYRSYGSYAMYDAVSGKVLVAGGGNIDNTPSYDSSVVIDLKNRVIDSNIGRLNIRRRQHNMTILADQSVLATGGHQGGNTLIDVRPEMAVNFAEIWSPETKQWTLLNENRTLRQYHSIAILLPDATVLVAGGGYCGECYQADHYEANSEIYYPPYLFEEGSSVPTKERPLILYPNENQIDPNKHFEVNYNDEFVIQTNQASSIRKITLVKLGSVTHSTNQEQRAMKLEYWQDGTVLRALAPLNRRIAPPGHYMMFIINEKGIPSVAEIIKVGQPLLTSSEPVSDRLHNGKTMYYKIKMQEAKGVSIKVSDPRVKLRASVAIYPTASNNSCKVIDETSCLLNSKSSEHVYISTQADIESGKSIDYTLTATLTKDYAYPPSEIELILLEEFKTVESKYIGSLFEFQKRWFMITNEDDSDRHCLLADSNQTKVRSIIAKPVNINVNWANNNCKTADLIDTSVPPGQLFLYQDRWFLTTGEADNNGHCLLDNSELASVVTPLESKPDSITIQWKNNNCTIDDIKDVEVNKAPTDPNELDALANSLFLYDGRWFLMQNSTLDPDQHCLFETSDIPSQYNILLEKKPDALKINWKDNFCSTSTGATNINLYPHPALGTYFKHQGIPWKTDSSTIGHCQLKNWDELDPNELPTAKELSINITAESWALSNFCN